MGQSEVGLSVIYGKVSKLRVSIENHTIDLCGDIDLEYIEGVLNYLQLSEVYKHIYNDTAYRLKDTPANTKILLDVFMMDCQRILIGDLKCL